MRGWVNSNTDLLSVKLHQSYGHTKRQRDSTVSNYADGRTSRGLITVGAVLSSVPLLSLA